MKQIDQIGLAHKMQEAVDYLPLNPTHKNRLVAVCEKPFNRNKLMELFIQPNLVVESLDQHVAMHEDKADGFGTLGSRLAQNMFSKSDDFQVNFTHFSNALKIPAFGPEYEDDDTRRNQKTEAPSRRGTIGAFWAFTFEWDTSDPLGLQVQFDWTWKKGANGKSALEVLDVSLREKFKDYRGIVVVWSGNKSIHIHLIFDPSHLSKFTIAELAERDGKSAEAKIRNHWSGDIRPNAIWEYYKSSWWKLNDLIRSTTGIDVEFDDSMQTLFQKRRLPWGMRAITDGGDFGMPSGLLVPQAVLLENLITNAPKKAHDYFLSSEEANLLPQKAPAKHGRVASSVMQVTDAILEPLKEYLKHHWKSEYPKPSHFEDVGGEIYLRFFNDEHDITPATCIGENYSRILYRGKGARTDEGTRCLPGNQTLGDLLHMICDQLDLDEAAQTDAEVSKPGRPTLKIWQRLFERQAMGGGIQNIYQGLRTSTSMVSMTTQRAIIKCVEGSGKSTAAIRLATDFQLEDHIEGYHQGSGLVAPANGHTVIATKSYDQCWEQYQAYVSWCDLNGLPINAVLLKSAPQYYREHCNSIGLPDEERINAQKALHLGYSSFVDAIADMQPDIYAAITKLKNAAWTSQVSRSDEIVEVCGFRRRLETLVFTTHSQAQQFNSPSKSRAWQHPDFDIEMDSDAWINLATQFRAYRIIHDEVSLEDLLHIATENDVDLAHRFKDDVAKVTGKPWSDTRNDERYKVYGTSKGKNWRAMKFFDLLDIIDAGLSEEDQIAVDFDHAPFGRDNHDAGIYRSTNGDVIYVKAKDWWFKTKARILITTTEELVAEIASRLIDADNKHTFKIEDWSSPLVFSDDPVELVPDARACSKNVQTLADSLLGDNDPLDIVISDIASGEKVISHLGAQGRNDLAKAKIATVLTFIGPEQYSKLNAVAQRFAIANPFGLFYRDRINQAVGRNQGLRRQNGSDSSHRIYVAPTFMNAMGGFKFFASGRYPAFLAA